MLNSISEINQREKCYQLYGVRLCSNYPFYSYLSPCVPDIPLPKLVFAYDNVPPFQVNWNKKEKVFSSLLTVAGKSIASFYQFDNCLAIRFLDDTIDYYLKPDRIDCYSNQSITDPTIEDFLFGPVLSLWLESCGVPVLHASAVNISGLAVAFLANSRSGKSTLAAAFLQAGQTLLTDDILALTEQQQRFWARPGLPQINLWPDQARYFIHDLPDLASTTVPVSSKKHFPTGANGLGAFCNSNQPIGCIYLPHRQPTTMGLTIKITSLRPVEAIFTLARFSFMANVVQSLGWQERRLDFFSRLVQQVPVRYIYYPEGYEYFDRITDAISEDLKNLSISFTPAG